MNGESKTKALNGSENSLCYGKPYCVKYVTVEDMADEFRVVRAIKHTVTVVPHDVRPRSVSVIMDVLRVLWFTTQ